MTLSKVLRWITHSLPHPPNTLGLEFLKVGPVQNIPSALFTSLLLAPPVIPPFWTSMAPADMGELSPPEHSSHDFLILGCS